MHAHGSGYGQYTQLLTGKLGLQKQACGGPRGSLSPAEKGPLTQRMQLYGGSDALCFLWSLSGAAAPGDFDDNVDAALLIQSLFMYVGVHACIPSPRILRNEIQLLIFVKLLCSCCINMYS